MTPRAFLISFIVIGLGFRMGRLVIVMARSRKRESARIDARPIFWVMTISYLAYSTLCATESFHARRPFSWTVGMIGLVLYIAALTLREEAMRDLGRYFSPHIEIRQEHRVIREGLYRYVRHPLLACMGLEIISLGLVFNACYSLLFIGLGFYMPLILIRKTLEERTLRQVLGESYRQYQNEVNAFLPHLSQLFKQGVRHV